MSLARKQERPRAADIPRQPQEQGPLYAQLEELIPWANQLGLYDAADWLARMTRLDSGTNEQKEAG